MTQQIKQNFQNGLFTWLNFTWVFTTDQFRKRYNRMGSNKRLPVTKTFNQTVPKDIVRILTVPLSAKAGKREYIKVTQVHRGGLSVQKR